MMGDSFRDVLINGETYFYIRYMSDIIETKNKWKIYNNIFNSCSEHIQANDKIIIDYCSHNNYTIIYISGISNSFNEIYESIDNKIYKSNRNIKNIECFDYGVYIKFHDKKLIAKLKMMMV